MLLLRRSLENGTAVSVTAADVVPDGAVTDTGASVRAAVSVDAVVMPLFVSFGTTTTPVIAAAAAVNKAAAMYIGFLRR